jgi:hypothetical protein
VRRKNELLVSTVGIVVLQGVLGATSMNASAAFVSRTPTTGPSPSRTAPPTALR